MSEVAKNLNAAADLIEKPHGFIQYSFVGVDEVPIVSFWSKEREVVPNCFCMVGAICFAIGVSPSEFNGEEEEFHPYIHSIFMAIGRRSIVTSPYKYLDVAAIYEYNDHHTQGECVATLRRAAEIASGVS